MTGIVAGILWIATMQSTTAPAPTSIATEAETEQVMRMERELWDAWKKHDLAAIKSRTAPDYLSVSETGNTNWQDIEKGFPDYKLESFSLGPIRALRVSPDVIVLSYPAEIRGSFRTKDVSRRVAESTIWVRRGGRWVNIYLHEITVEPRVRND